MKKYIDIIERLKDDYVKLQERFIDYQMASDKEIVAQVKQARKETAREILDMLYDMGIDKGMCEYCRTFDVNGVSLAEQICEKYGVDIEE